METVKQESKMMSRIVESLEQIVNINFEIESAMRQELSKIYPSPIEPSIIKEDPMCKEDPRDYCHKIAILISMLEEVTQGHEENLRHLREIV